MLIRRLRKDLTNSIDLPVRDPIFQDAKRTFQEPAPLLTPQPPGGLAGAFTLLATKISYPHPTPSNPHKERIIR